MFTAITLNLIHLCKYLNLVGFDLYLNSMALSFFNPMMKEFSPILESGWGSWLPSQNF